MDSRGMYEQQGATTMGDRKLIHPPIYRSYAHKI